MKPHAQTLAALTPESAADVFKALGEPARLRLYLAIRGAHPDDVCVCDLPDLDLKPATVSHHLRKLREAGLVESERRGTWVYYRASEWGRAVVGDVLTGLDASTRSASGGACEPSECGV